MALFARSHIHHRLLQLVLRDVARVVVHVGQVVRAESMNVPQADTLAQAVWAIKSGRRVTLGTPMQRLSRLSGLSGPAGLTGTETEAGIGAGIAVTIDIKVGIGSRFWDGFMVRFEIGFGIGEGAVDDRGLSASFDSTALRYGHHTVWQRLGIIVFTDS